MTDTLVIGAGPAGLTTAIALARAGAQVTVLEQDASELPARAADAFNQWQRRGVPQLRHSHAFLARLRVVLQHRAPDVLAALLANGGSELRFVNHLPETIVDRSPRPGDEDLVGLGLRRATFEWVLRQAALDQSGIRFEAGRSVRNLVVAPDDSSRVTGVWVDGEVISARTVVDATGRNSPLPRWLEEIGARAMSEEHRHVGLLYYSRFYRLMPGATAPDVEGQFGADLGFLKYAVFPGDDDTFSLTMGIAVEDEDLRGIRHAHAFDALAAILPTTGRWLAAGAIPLTDDVAVMARMRNRLRRLVVGDAPVVTGLVPVGDAAVCTNPLYGRGTSLALAHGFEVADLIVAQDDPAQLMVDADSLTMAELEPWYRASVAQDQLRPDDPAAAFQGAFFAAVRSDPDVWRAFMRTFNLLAPPDAMLNDPVVQAKVLEAAAAGDLGPVVVEGAPSRDEVLSIINAPAAA